MDVKRPIITEKSLNLASRGWYTFAVAKHARKEHIAQEVEAKYHVDVLSVRTVPMHGKVRRTGKKMTPTHRPDWKKALVQLKAGQKIDAFEVSTQEPVTPEPAVAKALAGEEMPRESKRKTNRKTIKSDESKKAR